MDAWKKARNRVYLLESMSSICANAYFKVYMALEAMGLKNSCVGKMVASELQVANNMTVIFSDGLFRNWDN